jgi:hypothetical protein
MYLCSPSVFTAHLQPERTPMHTSVNRVRPTAFAACAAAGALAAIAQTSARGARLDEMPAQTPSASDGGKSPAIPNAKAATQGTLGRSGCADESVTKLHSHAGAKNDGRHAPAKQLDASVRKTSAHAADVNRRRR